MLVGRGSRRPEADAHTVICARESWQLTVRVIGLWCPAPKRGVFPSWSPCSTPSNCGPTSRARRRYSTALS